MNNNIFPKLKIGRLSPKIPIIQGGMGVGISLSKLASAVANQGGIGVIAATGIGMVDIIPGKNARQSNIITLREEIKKARELSNGIIGVNVMMALIDCENLIRVSMEEKVDVIFLGAGLPRKFKDPELMNDIFKSNTLLIPIVSSGRATNIIFEYWKDHYKRVPEAVVVEGPLAGGHLGYKPAQIEDPNYSLESIVKDVVSVINKFEVELNIEIPVIAGGGIYTGEDIYRLFQLGAKGVQMGTRFVATHECDASDIFKQTYVDANEEDVQIIKSPVGLPGRAVINQFIKDVRAGEKKPFNCPWKCLHTCDYKTAPYCIFHALTNAKKGLMDKGFAFAGANASRIDKIISVKELIDSLMQEYALVAVKA
ncbi:NAD(P)H-dependent flavin oxidoreductase [Bacteroidota bacterium]